jgi:formylglycine-generating enzyme
MVRLPSGSYRPLYGSSGGERVEVRSFHLDRDPVTRADFLAFVRTHPRWSRSRASASAVDRASYLSGWVGDLDAGSATDLRRPVTGVSWLAAQAYCASRGSRLPTIHEWEYAAAADRTRRDATSDPRFVQHLVSLYASRSRPPAITAPPEPNVYGIRGLHDFGWEWVADFRSVQLSEHAHHTGARGHEALCASAAVGAVDPSNYPAFLRFALRSGLSERSALETLGFRCAA